MGVLANQRNGLIMVLQKSKNVPEPCVRHFAAFYKLSDFNHECITSCSIESVRVCCRPGSRRGGRLSRGSTFILGPPNHSSRNFRRSTTRFLHDKQLGPTATIPGSPSRRSTKIITNTGPKGYTTSTPANHNPSESEEILCGQSNECMLSRFTQDLVITITPLRSTRTMMGGIVGVSTLAAPRSRPSSSPCTYRSEGFPKNGESSRTPETSIKAKEKETKSKKRSGKYKLPESLIQPCRGKPESVSGHSFFRVWCSHAVSPSL